MSRTNSAATAIEELQKIIREKDERIRCLSFDLLRKEEEIALLRHKIFGRMSEKLSGEDATQGRLFNEAESNADDEPPEQPPDGPFVAVGAHTRKKTGRRPLPADLTRENKVHDIAEEEKICGCGAHLVRIGEETSEELLIIPASVKVIHHIRPKYACQKCDGENRETGTSVVKISPVEPRLIPKSIASASLVAFIATGKFCDGLPFSRQEKQFSRIGVDISRADMSNWIMAAGRAVAPLVELLQADLRAGPAAWADETKVLVHNEPGRPDTSESRMWVFLGGEPEKPVVLYQYHTTKSGKIPLVYLSGFQGYFQSDDYSGYNALGAEGGVIHVGCWAHARRKFMEAQKGGGKAGSAETALSFIARLYKAEKELRGKLASEELSLEAFARVRRRAVVPILREFRDWYRARMSEVPPESLIGKAYFYLHHEWDKLIRYSDSPYLTPDNNAAERAIRPFVIGRKAWLFMGCPSGAHASAALYSLIETAKANGIEPYLYLRYVFQNIPTARTPAEVQALLPYNLKRETLARSL